MPMPSVLPISLFWFVYFGALGIFFPYYSLYLKENASLTGTQVGMVLSMMPLVSIIAQPFWGQVADRTGERSRLIVLLSLGSAAGYGLLYLAEGFLPILVTTAFMASFATAVIPLSVSVTLAVLRSSGPYGFGLVRVWGTVGFLVLVVSFPWALERYQRMQGLGHNSTSISEPGLEVMFLATGFLILLAALLALRLPRVGVVALRAARGDWRRLLRNRPVLRLLLFAFGAFLFIQGPMGLFPVYVTAHGGSLNTVQQMWILMLIVEIPLIAFSGAGLTRLGARGLLATGVLAGGLRWAVCGLTDSPYIVYPVQMLHGVMVTGLMMGGPLYLERVAPENLRSTAQASLGMVGVGLGGIASNTGAGWLLQHLGTDAPYMIGGAGALIIGALVPWILPRAEKNGGRYH